MSAKLQKILDTQGWILADGATGTNLFNMGLEAGEAPEMWNDQHPDKISSLYQGAVDAGSDLFLTNSFGGNASRLKLHKAQGRAHELSRISAQIAREVADSAAREVIVAGAMGPTGDIMEPIGTLSHSDAVEIFEEQASGLMAGGADILWVETISAPEEFAAAAQAIGNINAPWCGTMSFDTAGRTMMGMTSRSMVEMVKALPNQPLAFGANCGVGSSDLLRTILGMSGAAPHLPLIAKGNAGIPKYVSGDIVYDGTPHLMAEYAIWARQCGASIIGGCCGTMPEHLAAMRQSLETPARDGRPELAAIAERFGAFSSKDDGLSGTPVKARPRRRRQS